MTHPIPDTATVEAFEHAVRLRGERRLGEALAAFADLLEGRLGQLDPDREELAAYHALKCATRLRRWDDTVRLGERVVARYPTHYEAFRYLGEALLNLDRLDEARAALSKAVELAPDDEGSRALLALASTETSELPAPRKPRPWPTRSHSFEDIGQLIDRYLLRGLPRDGFIAEQTVLMTLGSCFAHNLGTRLKRYGYKVHFEKIGEEVNSTYANRFLLDWVERGAHDGPTSIMEAVYGPVMRERLQQSISSSDVFVMTVGVAPCFFHYKTGEFMFSTMDSVTISERMARMSVMRTTTVAENAENIRQILGSVRRLAGRAVKVVLTVSPVPLSGTTEHSSAVIADCLSKSTLRLACQEVVSDPAVGDVYYWPSFEIVRWLGPHFGPEHARVYGADDGNSRHVSAWLVDIIVARFVRHFSADAANAAPGSA